jgi:hypothetical protein
MYWGQKFEGSKAMTAMLMHFVISGFYGNHGQLTYVETFK